jgi:hypothetical protein
MGTKLLLKRSDRRFTAAEVARCRRFGDEVAGVAFHWWLAGPHGACFTLLREANTTEERLQKAAARLYADRDVVELSVAEVEATSAEAVS